jgi:hypothetical protein
MTLVCDFHCFVDGTGPVEYGKPMWFQLWDAELTTTTDHLLSSKVTGLSSPYPSPYLAPI